MYPRYLKTYKTNKLREIVSQFYVRLENCDICPRACRVNRLKGEIGFCKTGLSPKVYSYLKHHGEEPAVSGDNGSGTIFFSNCNMKCVYCQNFKFSQEERGRQVQEEELASIMIELQGQGCHNINFVTPSHVIPQILKALIIAIEKGLKIPLVYNSSGYDSYASLKLLEGIFDIYLTDARYADNGHSLKYSGAFDYPEVNRLALKEIYRQVGIVKLDKNDIIESGLIIRHLVLPNSLSGTDDIMRFVSKELSQDVYISLMSQYFPCFKAKEYKELSRRISKAEYKEAICAMSHYGLKNGWTQDENGLDSFAGINIKAKI